MSHASFIFRRYKESLAAYDRALELKPREENAYLGKAQALWKLGRFKKLCISALSLPIFPVSQPAHIIHGFIDLSCAVGWG
jgi:tetratricopeptide (TPR) repeat protein